MADLGKEITNALELHVGSSLINGESEVWDDPDGGVVRLANALKHVVKACEDGAWFINMPGEKGGRRKVTAVDVDRLLAVVAVALGVREDGKD